MHIISVYAVLFGSDKRITRPFYDSFRVHHLISFHGQRFKWANMKRAKWAPQNFGGRNNIKIAQDFALMNGLELVNTIIKSEKNN